MRRAAAERPRTGRDGVVQTPVGAVPRVGTRLTMRDRSRSWAARWAIGRAEHLVEAGLYAVGDPSPESPVLVSANYGMSFDRLRAALHGRDAWLLVLDTRGINVWCAAGKGTFGTDELVHRVQATGLERVVTHRTLIVPQLGAPGVAAHVVTQACGFRVTYGPVRAEDLPAFLDAGSKATPAMRRVRFGVADRAVLVPVELVLGTRNALLLAAALLLLGGLGRDLYSLAGVRAVGLPSAALLLAAFALSATLGPLLLPWLPGRAFAIKGAALGAALALAVPFAVPSLGALHLAAWGLLVPAVASFTLLNFTGATPYTSLSGVLLEMRRALPLQATAGGLALLLWLVGLFLPTEVRP